MDEKAGIDLDRIARFGEKESTLSIRIPVEL